MGTIRWTKYKQGIQIGINEIIETEQDILAILVIENVSKGIIASRFRRDVLKSRNVDSDLRDGEYIEEECLIESEEEYKGGVASRMCTLGEAAGIGLFHKFEYPQTTILEYDSYVATLVRAGLWVSIFIFTLKRSADGTLLKVKLLAKELQETITLDP